jgi:glutathione peroxidase
MPFRSIDARCCLVATLLVLATSAGNAQAACDSLLDERLTTLQGEARDLCEYQGKVILVVNTASYCGFTRQYQDLQVLYERYRERGLVVLGFPSNDFGRQEPGSNEEVAQFCERNFGVRFPLFVKSSVASEGGSALFDRLAALTGERPRWNFHKYLIDRSATKAVSFASHLEPREQALLKQIDDWLGGR